MRRLLLRHCGDRGAAMVEFLFVGVLTLVPLFYLAIAVFGVQANVLGTTQAAREAGRMFVTSPDVATGVFRAQYAVRLALANHGIGDERVVVRFVERDTPCDADLPVAPDPGAASLEPGAVFAICVVSDIDIPAVPTWMEGESKTFSAKYIVKADKYRKIGAPEGGLS